MSNGAFEVRGDFAFVGRTFEEYCRMFALEPADLGPGRILDCGGGPGSFAAIAAGLAPVVAVDPAYGPPPARLADRCEAAVEHTAEQLRQKRDLFVLEEYGDVATRVRYLRAAFRRFLADYAANPGRYVAGALPALPFEAGAFDLVLSANFLFLYDDRLDREFHVASLRELARVSAGEVRVFPLHSLDRRRSALLDPVLDALASEGIAATLRSVPYEFQPGATEMLVLEGCGDRER